MASEADNTSNKTASETDGDTSSISNLTYQCQICSKTFENGMDLLDHACQHVNDGKGKEVPQREPSASVDISVDMLAFTLPEPKDEPEDDFESSSEKAPSEKVLSSRASTPEVFAIKVEEPDDFNTEKALENRFLSVQVTKLSNQDLDKYAVSNSEISEEEDVDKMSFGSKSEAGKTVKHIKSDPRPSSSKVSSKNSKTPNPTDAKKQVQSNRKRDSSAKASKTPGSKSNQSETTTNTNRVRTNSGSESSASKSTDSSKLTKSVVGNRRSEMSSKRRGSSSNAEGNVFCRICMETFNSKDALQEHGRIEHSLIMRNRGQNSTGRKNTATRTNGSDSAKSSFFKTGIKRKHPESSNIETAPKGRNEPSKPRDARATLRNAIKKKAVKTARLKIATSSERTMPKIQLRKNEPAKANTKNKTPDSNKAENTADTTKNKEDDENFEVEFPKYRKTVYKCMVCDHTYINLSKLKRHLATFKHKEAVAGLEGEHIKEIAVDDEDDVAENVATKTPKREVVPKSNGSSVAPKSATKATPKPSPRSVTPKPASRSVTPKKVASKPTPKNTTKPEASSVTPKSGAGNLTPKSSVRSIKKPARYEPEPPEDIEEDLDDSDRDADFVIDEDEDDEDDYEEEEEIPEKETKVSRLVPKVAVKECLVCGKSFKSSYNLTRHKLTHANLLTKAPPEGTDNQISTKQAIEPKEYVCGHCDEVLDSNETFMKHSARIHPKSDPQVRQKAPVSMLCQLCPKKFASKDSWLAHIRSHTDDMTFECHVCQKKGFTTAAEILSHVAEHEFENRYGCSHCGKKYIYDICRWYCQKSHEPTTIMPKKKTTSAQKSKSAPNLLNNIKIVKASTSEEKVVNVKGSPVKIVRSQEKKNTKIVQCTPNLKPKMLSLGEAIGIGGKRTETQSEKSKDEPSKDGVDNRSELSVSLSVEEVDEPIQNENMEVGLDDDDDSIGDNDSMDTESIVIEMKDNELRVVDKSRSQFVNAEAREQENLQIATVPTLPPGGATISPPDGATPKKYKSDPVKCTLCGKLYHAKEYLELHMKTVHATGLVEKPHACEHCDKRFVLRFQLRKHLLKTHGIRQEKPTKEAKERQYNLSRVPCELCGQMISSQNMKRHLQIKHDDLRYQCQTCNVRFERRMAYEIHMENHHTDESERIYECDICNMTFKYEAVYKKHYGRRRCGGPKKIALEGFDPNVLKCLYQDCGVICDSFRSLQLHEMNHPKSWMRCHTCDRKFLRSARLYDHIRTHHCAEDQVQGESLAESKPKYIRPKRICEVCGESFDGPKWLEIHVMTAHHGYRFKCEHCDKVYQNPKSLKAHKSDYHSGTYECGICGSQFAREVVYYRHLERMHTRDEERVIPCSNKCPQRFKYQQAMRNHLRWGVCPNSVKAARKREKIIQNGVQVKKREANTVFNAVKKSLAAANSGTNAPFLTENGSNAPQTFELPVQGDPNQRIIVVRRPNSGPASLSNSDIQEQLQTILSSNDMGGAYLRIIEDDMSAQNIPGIENGEDSNGLNIVYTSADNNVETLAAIPSLVDSNVGIQKSGMDASTSLPSTEIVSQNQAFPVTPIQNQNQHGIPEVEQSGIPTTQAAGIPEVAAAEAGIPVEVEIPENATEIPVVAAAEAGIPVEETNKSVVHMVVVETEDGNRHELNLTEEELNAVMSGAQFQLV